MKRLAFLLCLLAWPAAAQMQMACGERAEVVRNLKDRFDETPAATGLLDNAVVELFTSPAGSFTVVMTLPNGKACLVFTGSDWSAVKQKGTNL